MSDCPSCPLQETPYDAQLLAKKARVERAMAAHPRLSAVRVPELLASARQSGYRNRARMVVDPSAANAEALLGFYQEQGREIVAVHSCAAHHPQVEAALKALRPLLFADATLRAFTRFVDVRCTAGRPARGAREAAIITLAGQAAEAAEIQAIEAHAGALLSELGGSLDGLNVALHLNISADPNQAVLSGEQRVVGGESCLRIGLKLAQADPCELRVSPSAFFQVNHEQLEAVYPKIRPWLRTDGVLVDLYCGVGTHAIALAQLAAGATPQGAASGEAGFSDILGFDISESAIEQARINAEEAGLRAQFLAADDQHASAWIQARLSALSPESAVSVITNPARAGMSAEAIATAAEIGAERVFYLSCEPETLARDLDRFGDHGFELERLETFDFMPQTEHVETLAVLRCVPNLAAQPAYERAYHPTGRRRFSRGVSGPSALPVQVEQAVWIALVAGSVPAQGFLPFDRSKKARAAQKNGQAQAPIRVERLRKVEGNSVVRVHAQTLDDTELRRRFRAWKHPIIGDPDFGERGANHLAKRHSHLDRIALHCVGARAGQAWQRAPIPGQFLAMMRLPRTVLDEVE